MEQDIFELWKELSPSEAYLQGIPEYAGRIFVPTKENIENVMQRIKLLKSRTKDEVHIKFLSSLQAQLKYREPTHDLSEIVWTLFGHIIKGGIRPEQIISLLEYAEMILENAQTTNVLSDLPLILRIILTNKCNGLMGIMETILQETKDSELKDKIHTFIPKVKAYREKIQVDGIEKGDFSEIFPILTGSLSPNLGRSSHYSRQISEMYDYYETPNEIESRALGWLESELSELENAAVKLGELYDISSDIETIDSEIAKRSSIKKSELLGFIRSFRNKAQHVVEKHIVGINPKYETKILETPDYLLNFIPTAAMTMFDTLTEKPFNVFFVTTDEKRSPASSLPDIFQMIVHEEYGHCVNFSNSAVGFEWKPSLVERLNSTLHFPISEGISFHREYETLVFLESLAAKSQEELSKEEAELLEVLEKYTDLNTFILETKFVVYKWRIIRFLRAIGDVRINQNRQSLVEYVAWASQKTGFKNQTIFDQLFIFMENPGYAPCYSIAGMALREIQERAKKKGKNVKEFNTKASSMGFPPRTVFEKRLKDL